MLKLYNLYKQVILESTNVQLKTIQDAMRRNVAVNMVYDDGTKNANLGNRYCQILAIGETSKNNMAIRVYQISGANLKKNKKGETVHWKTFLINNIPADSFKPTEFKFYAPPDELYNALGDKTLNIPNNDGMANMAIFSDKSLENYRNKYKNWQSNLDNKTTNEPLVKNRGDNEERPQPNYPSPKDYEYSNLYSDKVDSGTDKEFETPQDEDEFELSQN